MELKKTFTSPWEKTSIVWANLLDMVRYLGACGARWGCRPARAGVRAAGVPSPSHRQSQSSSAQLRLRLPHVPVVWNPIIIMVVQQILLWMGFAPDAHPPHNHSGVAHPPHGGQGLQH